MLPRFSSAEHHHSPPAGIVLLHSAIRFAVQTVFCFEIPSHCHPSQDNNYESLSGGEVGGEWHKTREPGAREATAAPCRGPRAEVRVSCAVEDARAAAAAGYRQNFKQDRLYVDGEGGLQ